MTGREEAPNLLVQSPLLQRTKFTSAEVFVAINVVFLLVGFTTFFLTKSFNRFTAFTFFYSLASGLIRRLVTLNSSSFSIFSRRWTICFAIAIAFDNRWLRFTINILSLT